MATPHLLPLVSIGMPVYNRLDGLKSTLGNIQRQTYGNIEIIVSDNCSPNPAIETYMTEAARLDSRIRYVRQPVNLGIVRNFQFLQSAAKADYFMWAADDDEHTPDFIERCMDVMLTLPHVATVMPQTEIHFRTKHQRVPVTMPALLAADTVVENLRRFFARPEPCLMYGIHRTEAIHWFLHCESFPWIDCYFLCRLMLEGWKVVVLPGNVGFASGVDAADYEAKPLNDKPGSGFRYWPYFSGMMGSISHSLCLSFVQKLELTFRTAEFSLGNFVKFEQRANPWLCGVHRAFTLRALRFVLNMFPKQTG